MRLGNPTFVTVGLFGLFALGLGIRLHVLEAQYQVHGREMPFTLESALHFRMVEQVELFGELPGHDPMVEYPHGVNVRETYSVGDEYLYAAFSRYLPGSWTLAEKVRVIQAGFFCLGIPCLAVWIGLLFRSLWAGGLAASFYAVSLSSVIRSTGQELSRENGALPLLLAHLALAVGAERVRGKVAGWALSVLAGLALATAICFWDMMQFYVGLWAMWSFLILYRGDRALGSRRQQVWICSWLALCLVAMINPYHRAHGLMGSTSMLLAHGVTLSLAVGLAVRRLLGGDENRRWAPRRWVLPGCLVLVLAVGAAMASSNELNYGHFAELLWAKIRFFGVKPDDPSLLSFNQRIMWVPALHTANLRLAAWLFPAMLLLTFPAVSVLLFKFPTTPRRDAVRLVFFFGSSLIAFSLFVRFHVFLAVFSAGLLGGLLAVGMSLPGWPRKSCLILLLGGLVVEAAHVMDRPARWGIQGGYFQELRELTTWLEEHVAPEPVLANFGTSASILTYAGCPILLHPKFERNAIREQVASYGNALFKGEEKEFRDWAERAGARYFVYALGEFAPRMERYQMRYFVDALDPPENTAARLFEYRAGEARYFSERWSNRKYRVFKIRTRGDEQLSMDLLARARKALELGRIDEAEKRAQSALTYDPYNRLALQILDTVKRLREKDFTYVDDEDD